MVVCCRYSATWLATVAIMIIILSPRFANANEDMRRLLAFLFGEPQSLNVYNRLIRPVSNISDLLTVRIGLSLTQLIDLDERNQVLSTNAWLKHHWIDSRLRWNPSNFGGIEKIRIPATFLWLPDIVLYNSADGNFEVRLKAKATVHNNGTIWWEPPAIFRSICEINIEYFPFDEQVCSLKFGSWTYDGYQLNLIHLNARNEGPGSIEDAIDLTDYYESGEWDLLAVPATRSDRFYHCCPEPYTDLTFLIKIRRKTLFYTVNMLFPCVIMALVLTFLNKIQPFPVFFSFYKRFLSIFTFYLPADTRQKINMGISILVSLTVFVLLLNEIIPPTSRVIPLMAKYLLFTLILLTLSIILSVVVLNIHYFSPEFRKMPQWVRVIFLAILPRILGMKMYRDQDDMTTESARFRKTIFDQSAAAFIGAVTATRTRYDNDDSSDEEEKVNQCDQAAARKANSSYAMDDDFVARLTEKRRQGPPSNQRPMLMLLQAALNDVDYIAKRLKRQSDAKKKHDEWKYVARVVDRLLLYIFAAACISGTFAIIFQAYTLFDNRKALRGRLTR